LITFSELERFLGIGLPFSRDGGHWTSTQTLHRPQRDSAPIEYFRRQTWLTLSPKNKPYWLWYKECEPGGLKIRNTFIPAKTEA